MGGDPVYEAVFRRLFPSVGQGRFPRNSHNIVLRIRGVGFYTDMQILIYGQGSAEERYEAWWVRSGDPSVFRQLIDLRARLKTDDPDVLAASIHVEHRVIERPSERLVAAAKDVAQVTFPPSQDEGQILDGVEYSFYCRSISNHTSIELLGLTPPNSDHPLIKWIGAMRAAVEEQLNISSPESPRKGSTVK
jgi:hypothetical protein